MSPNQWGNKTKMSSQQSRICSRPPVLLFFSPPVQNRRRHSVLTWAMPSASSKSTALQESWICPGTLCTVTIWITNMSTIQMVESSLWAKWTATQIIKVILYNVQLVYVRLLDHSILLKVRYHELLWRETALLLQQSLPLFPGTESQFATSELCRAPYQTIKTVLTYFHLIKR